MSSKGIYTALSGSMAHANKLDTIANNIANSNTPAFKRDSQIFKEYLTAKEKLPDVLTVPRVPASIESFYDMQGADKGFVDTEGTATDFAQGSLRQTGNTLDLALEGQGFFEILTPRGVEYTRNGSFNISSDAKLVTKEGYPVLKEGQGDPNGRSITINARNINVSPSGQIYDGSIPLAKLSMVRVTDKDALTKVGSSLFTIKGNFNPQFVAATETKVHQGFLENSNVNIIREMTDMINTTRVFESTQRAIKAYDQMDEKLYNQVPKIA